MQIINAAALTEMATLAGVQTIGAGLGTVMLMLPPAAGGDVDEAIGDGVAIGVGVGTATDTAYRTKIYATPATNVIGPGGAPNVRVEPLTVAGPAKPSCSPSAELFGSKNAMK